MPNDYVLLTIRGTRIVQDLDAAAKLHNETAGSAPGIAACRSLGDLSHKVYVAATGHGAEKLSDARADELFFMDIWENAEGLGKFFSNPDVVEQGGRLFKEKQPDVFMPATGAYSLSLPTPHNKPNRFIGILRGTVKSPESAITAFKQGVGGMVRDARKAGLVSHELYVKLGPPSKDGSAEVLAYDVWNDLEAMVKVYGSPAMAEMGKLFVGRPSGSIWQQAPGGFNEW
jgi:hypothetical protein